MRVNGKLNSTDVIDVLTDLFILRRPPSCGAGGIGLKLWEAMRTNSDWENVAYMVLLILLVVFAFDNASNALRKRLIGGARA